MDIVQFAAAHGYRLKHLRPFDPPLGSEESAKIIPCRRKAWLWDAGGALGFDVPFGGRYRGQKAKALKALPGAHMVRWDDPEEPATPNGTGGIDGLISWDAWGPEHETALGPLRKRVLSATHRAKLAGALKRGRDEWERRQREHGAHESPAPLGASG